MPINGDTEAYFRCAGYAAYQSSVPQADPAKDGIQATTLAHLSSKGVKADLAELP